MKAKRFCTVGSSFVHGYKWMAAHLGTDEDVLAQLADRLAAAVIITECALALHQDQATHPARAVLRCSNNPPYIMSAVSLLRHRYGQSAPALPRPLPVASPTTGAPV
jgi:hypothetical protein